jgi:hypothetical protein
MVTVWRLYGGTKGKQPWISPAGREEPHQPQRLRRLAALRRLRRRAGVNFTIENGYYIKDTAYKKQP